MLVTASPVSKRILVAAIEDKGSQTQEAKSLSLIVSLGGSKLRYEVPGLARRLLLSPRVMTPVRHHYNLGEALPPVSLVPALRAEKCER